MRNGANTPQQRTLTSPKGNGRTEFRTSTALDQAIRVRTAWERAEEAKRVKNLVNERKDHVLSKGQAMLHVPFPRWRLRVSRRSSSPWNALSLRPPRRARKAVLASGSTVVVVNLIFNPPVFSDSMLIDADLREKFGLTKHSSNPFSKWKRIIFWANKVVSDPSDVFIQRISKPLRDHTSVSDIYAIMGTGSLIPDTWKSYDESTTLLRINQITLVYVVSFRTHVMKPFMILVQSEIPIS